MIQEEVQLESMFSIWPSRLEVKVYSSVRKSPWLEVPGFVKTIHWEAMCGLDQYGNAVEYEVPQGVITTKEHALYLAQEDARVTMTTVFLKEGRGNRAIH